MTHTKSLTNKDWGNRVIEDLQHLEINITLKEVEDMPTATYKNMIKKKQVKCKSLEYLLRIRNKRNGKGMELSYQNLTMQNYLFTEDIYISNEERKLIFPMRKKLVS